MMATGLLILKIIGLIVLGILGLILAILLIVLLVPVRYRAEVSYHNRIKGSAGVSWLLHILSCKIVYDTELDVVIRVLGFPIGREREKPFSEAEDDKDEPKETIIPVPEKALEKTPEATEVPEEASGKADTPKSDKPLHIKSEKRGKKKNPFSFERICDKLKRIRQKKDEIFSYLTDEENKKTLGLLWRQCKAIVMHILPTRIRGWLKFGFEDPYTTGQVLMYISPFYKWYSKQFQLIPVFEAAALEGDVKLKGRIRVGTVIVLGIRMMLDKNFRKLIRTMRK